MTNLSEMNFNTKKIVAILLVIVFFVLWAFWVYKYIQIQNAKKVQEVKELVYSWVKYDSCKKVLNNFDDYKKLKNLDLWKMSLEDFKKSCLNRFDLSKQYFDYPFCEDILKINNKDKLKEKYIYIDSFEQIQKKCAWDFLTLKFSTGSFFDIDNDFKSEIRLDLNNPIYDRDASIEERTNAKNRLLTYFEINPKVDLNADDVVLYDDYAIIEAKLKPTTKYTLKTLLKSDFQRKKESEKSLEKVSKTKEKINKEFVFTTPENKYLWLRVVNPVSLYMDKLPPRFKILDYDSGKKEVWVKICRVDNETFAKLDVLRWRKNLLKNEKDFLVSGIDKLKTFECKTKNIVLRDEKNNEIFVKKEFNFDDLIWNPARSGLYFVTFTDSKDRLFNGKLQKPALFWIIDSHITMKLSRNGEVFFFVNDFEWNPLANQNIRLYINEFKTKQRKWDYNLDKRVETYFSPLDKNVLSDEIRLWKTDKNGVLKVNIKDKVNDYFYKTFENINDYKWSWVDNSFFITAASNSNLTYLKSTWNAWIAPENFWYKLQQNRWDNEKWDKPILKTWGEIEPEFYSYTNTDRKLYLPWEDVYFKVVLRKSKWLQIPVWEKIEVKIEDSDDKEIYNKTLVVNEYWSIFDKIHLDKNSKLGYYKIFVSKWNDRIDYYNFAVEIFKNPKFKVDIALESDWLVNWVVKIDKTKEEKHRYWTEKKYIWDFKLKARVKAKYYNWADLSNAKFTYKVYKQEYYDNAWWNDCYYWCFWEPQKEFYSEWEGVLSGAWEAILEVPVKFESNYGDYKYIFEVTIKDSIGDEISGANSVIVKLPDEYKKYNPNFSLKFTSDKKFYKTGEEIKITWTLNWWAWNEYFDWKYLLLVKKKDFENKKVDDVRWYKRTITKPIEKLVDLMLVDSKNFEIDKNGNLKLVYKVKQPWEYVFEYAKVNDNYKILNYDLDDLIDEFKDGKQEIKVKVQKEIYLDDWSVNRILRKNKNLKKDEIIASATCEDKQETKAWWEKIRKLKGKECMYFDSKVTYETTIKADDLLDEQTKDFFTILAYSEDELNAKNPVIDDIKLRVFAEKNSYHLGEKARVLVRLPVSKGKILLTIEKQWVVKYELIDVKNNIFFKEFVVDDTFVPNAYIWVELIETYDENSKKVPEYKVGYTEIVVDKTDKKALIDIKTDKKTYSPRDEVNLDISVKDKWWKAVKSEVQVMVVDDSLISLMWNIDLEVLKKFYKKLPFQIQTSITNIAMLKNYYFARVGLVWGSGYWNFKGWDSAVSSRNIFKNTAYYKADLVTDNAWNLKTSFTLPDNLTNFRIIVVSNSKSNIFWVAQGNISVRKNVVVEPKVPHILRYGDSLKMWVNIFNNTENKVNFAVKLKADWLKIKNPNKAVTIAANRSDIVYFDVVNTKKNWIINYTFSVLWDSVKNSDKIEGKIEIKQSPVMLQYYLKNEVLDGKTKKTITFDIPENTDLENSVLELNFANTKIVWVEDIVKTLMEYPYWCIEQTTSSTMPNVVLKRFTNIFTDIDIDKKKLEENIKAWVERIKSMQTSDWGFAYWQGETESNLHITPYVTRSLIYMKKSWVSGLDDMIKKATNYLQKHKNDWKVNRYSKKEWWVTDLEKAEIYWALAYAGIEEDIRVDAKDRHTLLAYTYGLVLNKADLELIEKNIEKIEKLLNSWETHSRYWNDTSDKAIFTQMLLDYNNPKYNNLVNDLIDELYSKNWESYYYSTQSKNNAFMAFAKYLTKYNTWNPISYAFEIWNKKLKKWYLWKNKNIQKYDFVLNESIKDWKINILVWNLSDADLFVTATLKQYPKDVTKVEAYSNNIKVKRTFYEVIDEKKLDKCNSAINSYYNWDKKIDEIKECKGVYKQKIDDIFKLWKKYKVVDEVSGFSDWSRNITLEDYLSSSFVVFNNKFKTTSNTLKQNNRNWYFDHTELRPEVVFANASYVWWNKVNYEYYFTPSFEGKFILPPVTAYEMYNPKNRANSEYRVIEIIK